MFKKKIANQFQTYLSPTIIIQKVFKFYTQLTINLMEA
jgi:hypothetical protein